MADKGRGQKEGFHLGPIMWVSYFGLWVAGPHSFPCVGWVPLPFQKALGSPFSPTSHSLGRRQVNLCFHFGGSEENLPDIAKSRDATLDNKLFGSQLKILMKQNCFLFQGTSCHFFSQGLGTNCTRFSFDGDMNPSIILV